MVRKHGDRAEDSKYADHCANNIVTDNIDLLQFPIKFISVNTIMP